MSKFLVFSADWETEVEAESPEDAAYIGTELMLCERGEEFNIAKVVVAVNEKNLNMTSFPSVAMLEDLGLYHLASLLHGYLTNLK